MKKALFFTFLAICWSGTNVFSQQAAKPPEKTANAKLPFKWDVSLKLYPLIRTGRLGFLLRYSPNQRGAFRLAFDNVELGKTMTAQYIGVVDGPRLDTIRVTTSKFGYGNQRIGYEIQFNSGQHQFYCGVDLGFSFNFERHNPADAYASRMHNCSANPFVGLKYRILDRLSVSTELGGQLVYHHRSLIAHSREIIMENKLWGLSLDSFHLLNVSYHF